MAKSQYDEIWEDALKRYEKYTKTAIQVHISDDDTPNGLLQKLKGDFAQFTDKGKRLRNKMKPVLCLVGLFAELTGEAVGTVSLGLVDSTAMLTTLRLFRNIRRGRQSFQGFACCSRYPHDLFHPSQDNHLTHILSSLGIEERQL